MKLYRENYFYLEKIKPHDYSRSTKNTTMIQTDGGLSNPTGLGSKKLEKDRLI